MTLNEQLWHTSDRTRRFITPDAAVRPHGSLEIISLAGDEATVDPTWATRYEVTEDEAQAWASQEFGIALGELRRRIDRKLGRMRVSLDAARRAPVRADTSMTPDAIPAMLSLAKALPRAILDGLSGDPARVVAANGRLADVEARLNQAGIAVDRRLSDFPYRLAGLRAETARSRGGGDDPA
ncbi:hypothetical protein [Sphingomonas bacterium]|uniref:hypothetical protein n=1 Tax=Sphingomonas bacterium TaxID=1895847 RepID=UPI0026132A95|nr:hypothetical protein [Sphingomonas bacterium]MDB5678538.1 hypothetical protein [Sphingomonas bacterium]